MNIKRAKEEIANTVRAYLRKDETGKYLIPSLRQRPILLIGPPGIGKTQIMEQVARECGVALVAYTITHHTRQTAVGLPFIQKKRYGDAGNSSTENTQKEYSVTEYTMSEIIASVYDKMEATGLKEGILFIDEINCVSETLAPTMLQFLQYKTFGNQKVPEGFIIVTAGNPPEYNRSVRDFDIVTLDRVRQIDVEPDYEAWKEYAYKQSIHGTILAYLDVKRENFYRIETTPEGMFFATARGWEDLSEMLKACEELHLPVDRELIFQYIKHTEAARDFANYYELYNKYRKDYQIDEILKGNFSEKAASKLKAAPFDERLKVIGLLLSRLNQSFLQVYLTEGFMENLHGILKEWKGLLLENNNNGEELLQKIYTREEEAFTRKSEAGQISRNDEKIKHRTITALGNFIKILDSENIEDSGKAFERIKSEFEKEVSNRKAEIADVSQSLEYAFAFLETVFGESQEMVVFVTELTVNYYSAKFIGDYGCEPYYVYNRSLMFEERQQGILKEIEDSI